jgi:hypothetical protein
VEAVKEHDKIYIYVSYYTPHDVDRYHTFDIQKNLTSILAYSITMSALN